MGVESREKIGEGRQAEIYAWDDGNVLKLYREAGMGEAMEIAAFSALGSVPGIAPAFRGTIEVAGRPGLVIERVAGLDMLSLLERRPWRLISLAHALADAQARIHGIEAPAVLMESRDSLARRISLAPALPTDLRPIALRELDALPDGDRLCHGDFHPGNVLVSPSGVSVIDWNVASRGDPAGDFARTALLMRLGDPPPGTSKAFRVMVLLGRSLFARAYQRRYLRGRPVAPEARRAWGIVHAAARFAEGIEIEFESLEAFLRRT